METKNLPFEYALIAIKGGALMFGSMALVQILGAADARAEAQKLRLAAQQGGFQEGIDRVRCVGGIRYDVATGEYIDFTRQRVQ